MDASAARTANARIWVADAGGPTGFANTYGEGRWTQAQVSQWVSNSSPKGIGHRLARAIEAAMGKPEGSMDRPPASQAARIDANMLAESIAVLRRVARSAGRDFDEVTHADVIVATLEELANMPDNPSHADVIDFGARVREILERRGVVNGGGVESSSGGQAGGDARSEDGHQENARPARRRRDVG